MLLNKSVPADSSPRFMTSLALSTKLCSTKHTFPLVEQIVNSIRDLLLTTKVCVPLQHCQSYHAVLVINVVHRPHSCIRSLVFSLPWKLVWHPLVSQKKLVLREESSMSVPSQESPGLFLKNMVSSAMGTSFHLQRWATKDNSNKLYILGVFWKVLDSNIKKGLLVYAIGVFVKWSLTLGETLSIKMRKVH